MIAASARMSGTIAPWASVLNRGWVRTAISRDLAEARARDRRTRRARAAAAEYAGFEVAVTALSAGLVFAAADCALTGDSGASASTTPHATHTRRNRLTSGIGTLTTYISQSRKHVVREFTRTSPARKCNNFAILPYRLQPPPLQSTPR